MFKLSTDVVTFFSKTQRTTAELHFLVLFNVPIFEVFDRWVRLPTNIVKLLKGQNKEN